MKSLLRLAKAAARLRNVPTRAAVTAMRVPAFQRLLSLVDGFEFNPFDPAFIADPYPTLARLRARDPVYKSAFGIWLVTRYDDAIAVLSDQRFVHADLRGHVRREKAPGFDRMTRSDMVIALNPPDHTRLRRILGEAFAAHLGPDLRPRIETLAHLLLDRVEGAGRMEAVADFALPLPVTVIGEIFGLSPEESARCQVWAREATDALALLPTAAQVARANRATEQLAAYFTKLIEHRKVRPGHDFVSTLIAAQQRESNFSDAELIANCILFFAAGYETTAAFVGNSIRALMQHGEAWDQLRADPASITGALDELLRFDSPLQFFGRQAREDVALGGKRIRRGQTVMVLAGAANRDPARFPQPDRLDLKRPDSRSATFGHGLHQCVGRSLARLEGQVALEVLIRRLPTLRLGGEPVVWRQNGLLRAVDVLPVAW